MPTGTPGARLHGLAAAMLAGGLATAAPAAAQDITWRAPQLQFAVTGPAFCRLTANSAVHNHNPHAPIRLSLHNASPQRLVFSGTAILSGNGQSRTLPFSGRVSSNAVGAIALGLPFAGPLAGSTLSVTVTACNAE